MAAADVDDCSRVPAEVHPVHEGAAPQAGSIPERLRLAGRCAVAWSGVQYRSLTLAARAERFEGGRLDPCPVALCALEEIEIANRDPPCCRPAGRTPRRLALVGFRSLTATTGGTAVGAELRALEHQREAGRTADRREARAAI